MGKRCLTNSPSQVCDLAPQTELCATRKVVYSMQGNCSENIRDVTDLAKQHFKEGNLEIEEPVGTHSGIFSDRCSICSMRVWNKEKSTNSICFSYIFNCFLIMIVTQAHVRKSVTTEKLKHENHLKHKKINHSISEYFLSVFVCTVTTFFFLNKTGIILYIQLCNLLFFFKDFLKFLFI